MEESNRFAKQFEDANPYAAPAAEGLYREDGLDFQPARRLTRLAAVIADGLIGMVVAIPLFIGMVLSEPNEGPPNNGVLFMLFGTFFVAILAFGIVQMYLLARDGQTLGKKAVRVRIVMYDDGSNPGFWRAVGLRGFVNGLFGGIPLIGPLYSLLDILFIFGPERRCIHDYLAGTRVVEAR